MKPENVEIWAMCPVPKPTARCQSCLKRDFPAGWFIVLMVEAAGGEEGYFCDKHCGRKGKPMRHELGGET